LANLAVSSFASGGLRDGPFSYPNAAGCDDREVARKLGCVLPERGRDERGFEFSREPGQANQHDALRDPALAEHELAKVLVRGQEQRGFSCGKAGNLGVRDAGRKLQNVDNRVAVGPQANDDRPVYVFVGEELQETAGVSG